MADTTTSREPSILDVIAERARRASDTRLATNAAAGLVAAVVIGAWRGPAWYVLLAAALCFLGYGAWGITDRELRERVQPGRHAPVALRLLRIAAAVVGFGAAAFLMMTVLAVLLGRIIS